MSREDTLLLRLPSRGLSVGMRTAVALHYLGEDSYLDMCTVFGVAIATMSNCLWEVVDAVNTTLAMT